MQRSAGNARSSSPAGNARTLPPEMGRYEAIDVIGQGSFGAAILVRRQKELFVAKEMNICDMSAPDRDTMSDIMQRIATEQPAPIPPNYSDGLRMVLSRMLCKEQAIRPSIEALTRANILKSALQHIQSLLQEGQPVKLPSPAPTNAHAVVTQSPLPNTPPLNISNVPARSPVSDPCRSPPVNFREEDLTELENEILNVRRSGSAWLNAGWPRLPPASRLPAAPVESVPAAGLGCCGPHFCRRRNFRRWLVLGPSGVNVALLPTGPLPEPGLPVAPELAPARALAVPGAPPRPPRPLRLLGLRV
eukprot:gene3810-5943_t